MAIMKEKNIHSFLCPFRLLCLWSITQKHTCTHIHNPCVLFKPLFTYLTGCCRMKKGWDEMDESWKQRDGNRNTRGRAREWVREVGEKARDRESRCSLYPPATSMILAMEEMQRENNKKGWGALSIHFSAHDISPSSWSLCPALTHSLSLLCLMIFKATDMSGGKWKQKYTHKKNCRQ